MLFYILSTAAIIYLIYFTRTEIAAQKELREVRRISRIGAEYREGTYFMYPSYPIYRDLQLKWQYFLTLTECYAEC